LPGFFYFFKLMFSYFFIFFVIVYGLPSIKLTLSSWQGSPVSKVNVGSLLFFFLFKIDLFQKKFLLFFFYEIVSKFC